MNTMPLGKLEKVRVRDAWPDEARNFTPWLSTEGLELLSDEIGVGLQLIKCEHQVGRYSLDMLACEVGEGEASTERLVVIENQFGSTDHDHLGKLMTYASGVGDETQGARTVVWVAEDFREEHQRSLAWLNEVAQSAVRFYGVQLELYRIGTSAPAPSLNVLVRPNEVARARRDAPSNNVSGDRKSFLCRVLDRVQEILRRKGSSFFSSVAPTGLLDSSRARAIGGSSCIHGGPTG